MSDPTHAPKPCLCCDELLIVTEERNRYIDAYREKKAECALLEARAAGLEQAIIRALKACPFCEAGQCRADAHEWLALALAAALAPAAGEKDG